MSSSSLVAWLDHSAEQQQRINEMLASLGDRGTLDDLGIGTIRDAFSDLLFPGSSFVQTRARYFLFIPWIYSRLAERRVADLVGRGVNAEKQLILQLLEGGDLDGL